MKTSQLSVSTSRNGFEEKLLCLLIPTAEETTASKQMEWKITAHVALSSCDRGAPSHCPPSGHDMGLTDDGNLTEGVDLGPGGP